MLSMLMKLKQICNHPAQFLHQIGDGYSPSADDKRSGKLMRTVELLEEMLAVDDRALVFTQFAEMGHLLARFSPTALRRVQHSFFTGAPLRANGRRWWNNSRKMPDGPPIFILSLKAGGTGPQSHTGHPCLSF